MLRGCAIIVTRSLSWVIVARCNNYFFWIWSVRMMSLHTSSWLRGPKCRLYRSMPGHMVPQTIRVAGFILRKPVLVVFDSGSSNNFISEALARWLRLMVETSSSCKVIMADGMTILTPGTCQISSALLGHVLTFRSFYYQFRVRMLCWERNGSRKQAKWPSISSNWWLEFGLPNWEWCCLMNDPAISVKWAIVQVQSFVCLAAF